MLRGQQKNTTCPIPIDAHHMPNVCSSENEYKSHDFETEMFNTTNVGSSPNEDKNMRTYIFYCSLCLGTIEPSTNTQVKSRVANIIVAGKILSGCRYDVPF